MAKAETDAVFLGKLSRAGKRLKKLVAPAREANAWRRLLLDIVN